MLREEIVHTRNQWCNQKVYDCFKCVIKEPSYSMAHECKYDLKEISMELMARIDITVYEYDMIRVIKLQVWTAEVKLNCWREELLCIVHEHWIRIYSFWFVMYYVVFKIQKNLNDLTKLCFLLLWNGISLLPWITESNFTANAGDTLYLLNVYPDITVANSCGYTINEIHFILHYVFFIISKSTIDLLVNQLKLYHVPLSHTIQYGPMLFDTVMLFVQYNACGIQLLSCFPW